MASDAAVEGVSGAVGAMIACVATYPLMTVSTQQAVNLRASQEADSKQCRRKGAISDLVQIIQTRGWQGLFPGIQAALLGTGVSQGVYFYLYSLLRKAAVERRRASGLKGPAAQDIGIAGSLLVASLAGCGNVILTNPFWVLVTHMQTRRQDDNEASNGPVAVAKSIYADGGVLGFWKGVVPTLVMVANPTAQYMIYEWLKARLAEYKSKGSVQKRSRETASEIFLMSALAKLGATLGTYPMLLVKSRLQAAGSDQQYSGTLDAIQKIYDLEGFNGFYKGMRTKIVQSVLAAALLFMLKEKITAGVRKALRA